MSTVNHLHYLGILLLFLLTLGCSKPVEPDKVSPPAVILTVEDASCTEVWLRGQFSTEEPVTSVTLSINDSIIYRNTIFPADTVFFDTRLEPNRLYLYKAVVTDQKGKKYDFKSEVRTLDTTSSDYVWQTFVFGQHSHSIIRDILVIDENNIWAVGSIYLKDSLGNDDFKKYNALHWDGTNWEILRIPYEYNGGVSYSELYAISRFNKNDLWFGVSNIVELISGQYKPMVVPIEVFPSLINDMFIGENKKAYLLGNNGNLAHYNGTSWTKLESQTNLDLTSITYYEEKYFITGHSTTNGFTCLLRMENNIITKIFEGHGNTLINGEYVSILQDIRWFSKYGLYLNAGQSIVRLNNDGNFIPIRKGESTMYVTAMDGNGHNNIWLAGSGGNIAHYNGLGIREYQELRKVSKRYIAVSSTVNTVAAGGFDYYSSIFSRAVISIGKKIR